MLCKVIYLQVPGIRLWTSLESNFSACHRGYGGGGGGDSGDGESAGGGDGGSGGDGDGGDGNDDGGGNSGGCCWLWCQ